MRNKFLIMEDYAIVYINRRNGDVHEVLIDIEDLTELQLINKTIGIYFNTNGIPYARVSINGKITPLHRYLLNYEGECVVDHINNNSLDCRKDNLRVTTISKNNSNRKYDKNTGHKGIERVDTNKYIASRMFHGIEFRSSAANLSDAIKKMEEIDRVIKSLIDNETF